MCHRHVPAGARYRLAGTRARLPRLTPGGGGAERAHQRRAHARVHGFTPCGGRGCVQLAHLHAHRLARGGSVGGRVDGGVDQRVVQAAQRVAELLVRGRRRRRRPRCGGPGGARPPTHAATRRLLSRAGAPQAPRDLHVMTGADGSMQLTVGGQTVAFDDALGDGAEHDAFAINALNCDELIDVAGGAAVATAAPAARYRGSVVPPAAR